MINYLQQGSKDNYRKAECPKYTVFYLCKLTQLHECCDVDMVLLCDACMQASYLPHNLPKIQT